MQKPLSRPGAWLCLLGSTLALVAFFLPAYGPASGSMWDMLLQQSFRGNTLILVGLGVLLFLLSGTVLACWAMLFGSPEWDAMGLYLTFTRSALVYYLIMTLFIALFVLWFSLELDGEIGDITLEGILSLVDIGAWLMAIGLILSLIGGIRLERESRHPIGH